MTLPTKQDYEEMQRELEQLGWVKMPRLNLMAHPDKPNAFKSLTTEIMLKKSVK